ncbi:UNVERIFIED_CONTAM: hypothetical protein PYX00_006077 [Menopon gallinae]|uniref:Protein Abitram n=1 Tax=Menopon gallinae TaxID=328185 RepID=A0AAW2HU58_9NEOP
MKRNIVKIEDSFDRVEEYPSVTERYYKRYYYKSGDSACPDHCVLLHSNRICLITLSPSHPLIKNKKNVSKLDFQVSDKLDRLENKVVGKAKKGGQYIQPDSVLCFAECEDGEKYPVFGCISGKLIEINELLIDDCNLMWKKPETEGYIAIILPSKKDFDWKSQNLINSDAYEKIVQSSQS